MMANPQMAAVQRQKAIDDYWKATAKKKAAPIPLGLPAAAEANFGQQRIAANEAFRTQGVANDFARSGAAQDYASQFRDLSQRFHQQREGMPYGANAHGMLGSGVWRQQVQDYGQNRMRAFGDLNTAKANELGSYDLVRQNIEAQRRQALANIEAQRNSMMGQIAPGTIR